MNFKRPRNSKATALQFTKFALNGVPEVDKSKHEVKNKEMQKESVIQSQIVDFLELQSALGRLYFQRCNVMGTYDPTTNKHRSLPSGVHKGFPDIIIFIKGKTIAIELKSSTGKQRVDQEFVQTQLEEQGVDYYLIRTFPYFEQVIKKYLN